MQKQTLTLEHLLYGLIFILALSVRGIGVGQLPLSDFEADHAMQAVQVARGDAAELGNQPGYVLLTGLTFFLTGSSEAMARLWPLIMGSALVLVPFLLRDKLGRKVALLAAFGLALDPGLVSLSQLAGGPMMAVSFTLLAGTTWMLGWTVAGGILAGLALLSGPAVIGGAAALAGAVGLVRLLGVFPEATAEMSEVESPAQTGSLSPARVGLLAAGATLLLAGTLFLRFPQGLSAFASALPAYLAGWSTPSNVPVLRLLMAFLSYPLLAIIFGVLGIVRAWMGAGEEGAIGRALSIWLGVSLAFVLMYPGRQVADLAWTLVPLWGLAAFAFAPFLPTEREAVSGNAVSENALSWALAGLVIVMLMSVWVNFAGLTASNAEGQLLLLRWLVIGGAIVLAVLSAVLVGLGWSSDAAKQGLAWGIALALGLAMFTGIWGASQREISARMVLWQPVPGAGQQTLFTQTLGDLGDWTLGREDSIQVISLVDEPSVRWALRKLPNVSFQDALSREALPDVIISHQDDAELSLGSAYRGQDFAWWVYPNWDVWTSRDWFKWLAFREANGGTQAIIVWARGDLFPSGEATLDIEDPIEIDLSDDGSDFVPEEEIIDGGEPLK